VRLGVLLLWLAVAVPVSAGEMQLDPPAVVQGGVVTLRYLGVPPASAVARWFSRPLFLHPTDSGVQRLLGVDLETEPGRYQIPIRVETRTGEIERFQLELEVEPRSRSVEALTLPDVMVSPKLPETLTRIDREVEQLKALYQLDTPPRFSDQFRLPVSDPIGSRFGLQRILNGQPRSPHSGVDFRSPLGRLVHAPAPAMVVATGDYYFTGRTVVLNHGGGLISLYAHLDRVLVAEGEVIDIGQALGEVGATGRATGAHLHWSLRLNAARVDPLALFEVFNGEKP